MRLLLDELRCILVMIRPVLSGAIEGVEVRKGKCFALRGQSRVRLRRRGH